MGVKLQKIASCLIVICLTIAILAGLTSITESKGSVQKYMQFFEQDADFDVLFLGSSKVINGILPMELWNDYGIISYNMGGHANTIPTSYWVLRNALDYTTPKCVVFDCMGTGMNIRISNSFDYSHLSFDAFPLSSTKIQAVSDLVIPEEWEDWQTKRIELLWNFSIYHSRWIDIDAGEFYPYYTRQKGAEPRVNVSIPAQMATVSPDARSTTETVGMEYLIKAIQLCQERGIDVILIHIPYPTTEAGRIEANTIQDIANAYGVEYINFFNMDIVDYQTDMHDSDSHLNPSGAFKITDYLGRVLSEQYEIPDQRNHPDYQSWHYDAEIYHQEKVKLFENATCAWNYWMLLSDDDFSFIADLSESDLKQDEVLTALLRNAEIQPENVSGRCIIAADRSSGTVTYTAYDSLLQGPAETALGTLSLDEEGVKLDGQIFWHTGEPEALSAAMRFALLNLENDLEGTAQFSAGEIRSPYAE